MTPRASYRSAAAFGGLGFVATTVLGLASTILTARLYGIEVIGEFALATAPVTAVWYLSTARERPAFVRELATLEPRAPRVTGLFAAVQAFSSVLCLVVALLAMPVVILVFEGPVGRPELVAPTLLGLAGHVLVTNTGWNLDAVLAAFRAGRELFFIRLHQIVAFIVVAVALSAVTDSVWGLVCSTVASYATSLVHRLVAVRRYMRLVVPRAEVRAGFRTLPELIRFGLKLVPGGIAQGVGQEVGTWVLGMMGNVAAVGAYSRAWTLGRRLTEVNWRANEMLLPTLVERRSTGDGAGFDRALVDTTRYLAVALLVPAAAVGGAAGPVMALYGPGFEQGATALAVLVAVPVVIAVVAVLRQVLLVVDRPGLTSVIAIGGTAVTTAATIAGAQGLGVTGAALGLLAGSLAEAAWITTVTLGHLHGPLRELWPARQLAATLAAYVAGFGAGRLAAELLPGVPGLLPALAAGGLVFAVVLVAAGGVGPRDRARIASFVSRLHRRSRRAAAGQPAARV